MKVEQGIEGIVQVIAGNRMPMIGVTPTPPAGIATTVYIYEPTNITDVVRVGMSPSYQSIKTKLIASVESDSTGHFVVALPVGSYSLFTKVKGLFYANLFDDKNNIALTIVEEGKKTKVEIKVSAGATY